MQPPYDNDYGWTQTGGPVPPRRNMPQQSAPISDADQYGGSVPPQPLAPPPVIGYDPNAGFQQAPGFDDDGSSAQQQPQRSRTVHTRAIDTDYTPPDTGMPRRRRRVKKSSMIALIAALLLLVILFVLLFGRSCTGSSYGFITESSLMKHSGDALIVRDEIIYTQNGITLIDYEAEESSSLDRGDHVCTVYSSGFSSTELTKLENYRTQIKNYHKTLLSSQNVTDSKLNSLESVILARAVETQSLVQGAKGNLINQEELLSEAMQNRQAYLKLKYPDDQKLTRLYEDENTQSQRISSWTKQYSAQKSGLVSFYTDGYETVLNMSTWLDLGPAEVRKLFKGAPQDTSRSRNTVNIYRMVGTDSWGVLMLADEKDWTPIEGQSYQLVIESFDNMVVQAQVESFTLSGGEMLVRLNILDPESSILSALYMRDCRVTLGETAANSLCVPESAVMQENGINYVAIWYNEWNGWARAEVNILSENKAEHTITITPKYQGQLQVGMRVKTDW